MVKTIFTKKIVTLITVVLILSICFFIIINQKKSIDILQEENNNTYILCLEQIADRIEEYEKSKDEVSLRNASSWAGKAVIASKNMNLEKKQYLIPLAVLMNDFFANTNRPDAAVKTKKIYKLIPCLREVAKDPNNKQKIDEFTYALQGAY